jgi:hypothetical protein
LVLIFKKCKILKFHDLIAKIGIPILEIHPDWDLDFSDPDLGDELKESDN